MQIILHFIIFALLLTGLFFEMNLFRKKQNISISKQAISEKIKNIDEGFGRLSLKERIITSIKNVITMNGIRMRTFWVLVMFTGVLGLGIGRFLFTDLFLSLATAITVLPLPYIFLKVRARWYQRNQEELLENTMSIITNSYISCNDIIKAVNENLPKLDVAKPFAEFITDVTLIDSNVKRALRRLELKINNKYFSEWIDLLVLSQEKSGEMRFILPAVVDGMNDAKKLQIEADTVMANVWKEYFISIVLAFSIIPILRWSNAGWFSILIGTLIGKFLLVLMLALTLISAFVLLKINKPL